MTVASDMFYIATELASGSVAPSRQGELANALLKLAAQARKATITLDALYADAFTSELEAFEPE